MEREDLVTELRMLGVSGRVLIWSIPLAFAVVTLTAHFTGGTYGFSMEGPVLDASRPWPERVWLAVASLPMLGVFTLGLYQFERLLADFQRGEILTRKTTRRILWIASLLLANAFVHFVSEVGLPGARHFLFAEPIDVDFPVEELLLGVGAWCIARALVLAAEIADEAEHTV